MRRSLIGALAIVATVSACSDKALNITNPNSPTPTSAAADPAALQLLATGLLGDLRGSRGGYIANLGIFGRESYTYTVQEGRNTTHYLLGTGTGAAQKIDNSGFATGQWGVQYNAMRDNYNFQNAVTNSGALTAQQKSAALGFAQVLRAYELLQVIATRDTIGAVTEIKETASELAPFVSRDSVYKYILGTLDDGIAKLGAGGSAFPFNLHAGFAGFNTPATYAQFAQAIKARAAAYYATSGGGATAWATTLSALGSSFLNAAATTRAAFDVGVYDVYGASPEATNGLNMVNNTDLYAHMSIATDVQKKADLTNDNRYLAKIGARTSRSSTFAATSSLGFNIWAGQTTPIAEIRNEELILLRAEAKLGTGDKAGAIADLNIVRVNSGGLATQPLTVNAASTTDVILNAILYEKRLSLLMEGHRWVDLRRYGKLATLPLDLPTHFVAKVMPVPQGECLVRAGKATALLGPGC